MEQGADKQQEGRGVQVTAVMCREQWVVPDCVLEQQLCHQGLLKSGASAAGHAGVAVSAGAFSLGLGFSARLSEKCTSEPSWQ